MQTAPDNTPLTAKEQGWLRCLKFCVAYRKSLDRSMGAEGVFSHDQDEAEIAQLERRRTFWSSK
jgi:hypothetical protein